MSENCGIAEDRCLEIDGEIRTKNVSTPSAVTLHDGAADDVLLLGRSCDEKNRSGVPMMDEQRDEPKAPECCAPKKRRTRRGKPKRKHHPYDMKNARKTSSNKIMKPEAPYNSNQFLLEDHGEIEELDEDLKHVDRISTTSAARTRDSSFSVDSDREEFYSSPDDEEQFLINDFAVQYESVKGERLQSMTKEQLIQEYLALESKVELLSMRLQHNRQQRIAGGPGGGGGASSGILQQQQHNVSSTMMDDSFNTCNKSCELSDDLNLADLTSAAIEQQPATSPLNNTMSSDNVAPNFSTKSDLQREIDRLIAENEALKRENAMLKSSVAASSTPTRTTNNDDKGCTSDDSEDSETDSDDSCGSSTSSASSTSTTTSSTNSKTSRGSSAKTANSPLLDYSQTNGHSSPIETA